MCSTRGVREAMVVVPVTAGSAVNEVDLISAQDARSCC